MPIKRIEMCKNKLKEKEIGKLSLIITKKDQMSGLLPETPPEK